MVAHFSRLDYGDTRVAVTLVRGVAREWQRDRILDDVGAYGLRDIEHHTLEGTEVAAHELLQGRRSEAVVLSAETHDNVSPVRANELVHLAVATEQLVSVPDPFFRRRFRQHERQYADQMAFVQRRF